MDGNLTSVSPGELYTRLGTALAPMLVDVRRQEALSADDRLIIGAYHRPPEDVNRWLNFGGTQYLRSESEGHPWAINTVSTRKPASRACTIARANGGSGERKLFILAASPK